MLVKYFFSYYEIFIISFFDFICNSVNFNMKWEYMKVMFKIEVDVDSWVMVDIKV